MANREIKQTTRDALSAYVAECDSLREAARRLGLQPGTLSDIQNARHDHVSARLEDRVRQALGLNPLNHRNYMSQRPWISRKDAILLAQAGVTWRQVFDLGMNFLRLTQGVKYEVAVVGQPPGYEQIPLNFDGEPATLNVVSTVWRGEAHDEAGEDADNGAGG